jgi:hypothetical protein
MLYASERFLSQIYDSAKVTPKIDSNGEQAVDDKGNLLYDPFVLPKFRVLLLTSPSVFSTTKISNYGVYSTWTKSTSNTQSSIIGNFGSELTSDGRLNAKYIGGEGDKGVKGESAAYQVSWKIICRPATVSGRQQRWRAFRRG